MSAEAVLMVFVTLICVPQALADDWDVCIGKLPKQAIAGCTKIIKAAREPPKHIAMAYRNRGIAYGNLAMHEKALADFSSAIERDPEFAAAYYNRGLAHYNLRHAKLAIADFTKAIALKPDYAEALGMRGLTYFMLGMYDIALADLDDAINLDPKNGVSFFNRADTHEKMGNLEKATPDWQRAVVLLSKDDKWRKIAQERLALNKKAIAKQQKATAPQ